MPCQKVHLILVVFLTAAQSTIPLIYCLSRQFFKFDQNYGLCLPLIIAIPEATTFVPECHDKWD
jgi:hypothetical protein